jgi:iron complex transport system substrate-binding protein
LLLFAAAALFAVACGGSDGGLTPSSTTSGSAPSTASSAPPAAGGARESAPVLPAKVTDKDGKTVEVKDVSRIIPLTGDVAEVISALGLQQNVVAADVSATLPPDYQKLPSIGYQRTLSAEGIISMKPSVIIGTDIAGPPEVLEQIRSIGIPVVLLKSVQTLDGIAPKIRQIGAALGVPNRGEELAKATQGDIDAALKKASAARGKPNTMFLYLRGANVQVIMGEGSGADALIKAAGGKDAGVDAGIKGSKPITPEALVAAQPEVFLVLTAGLQSVGGVDGLVKIPGVAQTPAGKNRKVIVMDDQYLLGFNSQAGKALMELVNKMHPEYS